MEKLPIDIKWNNIVVRSWIRITEFNTLRELARDKDYCEIGTFRGGSLIAVEPTARSILCIDPESGDGNYRHIFYDMISKIPKARLWREKSTRISQYLRDGIFDILFIDGNHGDPHPSYDWNLMYRTVRKGGIIALHDYHEENPSPESSFNGVYNLVNGDIIKEKVAGRCDSLIWYIKGEFK